MQASREKGSLQTYWRPVHSEGRCFAKAFLLCCLYAAGVGVSGSPHGDAEGKTWTIEAVMPEHPAPAESYLCMRVDLPEMNSLKLTGIEPLSQEALVHHMLLFGRIDLQLPPHSLYLQQDTIPIISRVLHMRKRSIFEPVLVSATLNIIKVGQCRCTEAN